MIPLKRITVLAVWCIFFICLVSVLFSNAKLIEDSNLNEQQLQLYKNFVQEENDRTLKVIQSSTQWFRLYKDGTYEELPPPQYRESVVLTPTQREEIRKLSHVTPPFWMFWEDTLTVKEKDAISLRLMLGGIMWLFYGFLTGGIITGLLWAFGWSLIFIPNMGPVGGLILVLMFGRTVQKEGQKARKNLDYS